VVFVSPPENTRGPKLFWLIIVSVDLLTCHFKIWSDYHPTQGSGRSPAHVPFPQFVYQSHMRLPKCVQNLQLPILIHDSFRLHHTRIRTCWERVQNCASRRDLHLRFNGRMRALSQRPFPGSNEDGKSCRSRRKDQRNFPGPAPRVDGPTLYG